MGEAADAVEHRFRVAEVAPDGHIRPPEADRRRRQQCRHERLVADERVEPAALLSVRPVADEHGVGCSSGVGGERVEPARRRDAVGIGEGEAVVLRRFDAEA